MNTDKDQQQEDSSEEAKEPLWGQQNRTILRRLFQYIKPYRKWLFLGLLTLLIDVALSQLLPYKFGQLVGSVFSAKDTNLLKQIMLVIFAVLAVQAVFDFFNHIALTYAGEKVVAQIRKDVYAHLQQLPLTFYDNHRTGEIVSRLTNDVSLLKQAVSDGIVQFIGHILQLLTGIVIIFLISWRLTLVILLIVPVVIAVLFLLGDRIEKSSRVVQDNLAKAASILEETTSGIRIVKSFARQAYEISRFSGKVDTVLQAAMRQARIEALMSSSIGFVVFSGIVTTLWFGGVEVINDRLNSELYFAYILYVFGIAAAMGMLTFIYGRFQSALGSGKRVFDLLDIVPEISDNPHAVPLPPIEGHIHFNSVCFYYDEETPVLHDISFQVRPAQTIALVGPSGAGKSTLVNLIPRFYDIASGQITIDGYDIQGVRLHSLWEQTGIVPQETILFAQSVADNIRYGRLEATQEEIEAAAKAANAHDFIVNDLPDGYDTLVGERGVKLSGGQRQRIAIARAILKDPRILILDEATSSLDSESEHLIQEALERLMQGRTSFVIAHRLSTIVNADWILVMADGQIVEQGTHATLLDQKGLYKQLCDFQFRAV